MLVFGFGPAVLGALDGRGARGQQAQVALTTSCGNSLHQDVMRADMERVAGQVVPGEQYRFPVGQGPFARTGERSAVQDPLVL